MTGISHNAMQQSSANPSQTQSSSNLCQFQTASPTPLSPDVTSVVSLLLWFSF